MAEKKKNSNSNNINLKFLINAQYLKDLSFENPQAPESLKNIKSSLIEISKKSGLKSIFDGIKLVINEIDKK